MGLLSKAIETDEQDGYDYYAYSITELGIDILLKNESIFQPKPQQQVPQKSTLGQIDF